MTYIFFCFSRFFCFARRSHLERPKNAGHTAPGGIPWHFDWVNDEYATGLSFLIFVSISLKLQSGLAGDNNMVRQRKNNPPSSPRTYEMRPNKRSRKDNLNISTSTNDDPPLVSANKPKWNWLLLESNGFTKKRRIRVYRGLESPPLPALAPAPAPMIRSQEQSESDHIELLCTNNNNNERKKTSTKRKMEVRDGLKGMANYTPGSPVSKSRVGGSKQVSSSVKKRSCRRVIKAQEQSESDHIELLCTNNTRNNNEKKTTTSTKKKKYKPKVMANTPGSPASNFPGGGGSKQVSLSVKKQPSCRRALDFSSGYTEEKTMTFYTKGGFSFTRKVNKYHYKHEVDRLKILECNAKEEEEWWKNEHELFRQRALSFINSIRPVQGNRSFMGWKGSVVDSVVGVFLTQNTADNMSSSAFMTLASKYPKETIIGDLKNESHTDHALDWNAVRCAQLQEISDAIQERGMNYVLAERILTFLNCIHDNKSGLLDLEWLRNTEPAKATDYLMEVYGLGLKSTECLRLLALRQKAFPVDRHVSRIVVRLGWVPIEKLPDGFLIHQLEEYPVIERVQEYLSHRLSTLDVETLHELHYQMITFGKVFCTKKKPNCSSCPLKEDCKHFASKFGSNSCLQPGPGENTLVPVIPGRTEGVTPVFPSPECSSKLEMEEDIEDMCRDPKVHPVSKGGELLAKAWNYMSEKNIPLDRNAVSQALITVSAEEASSPMSRLRFAKRLRTEHEVYELPDLHPLVQALEKRDHDDGHPYLLAIWPLGETLNSSVTEKEECRSLISSDLREEEEEMVLGTFLVPCWTATRGSFPLDGTFFQINEVFADDESSRNPLVLPRKSLIDLNTKTLFCGTSITNIFKGMSRQKIQDCFWKGYVCLRGFCMKTRAPRPLHQQFHPTLSKVVKINGAVKSPRRQKHG